MPELNQQIEETRPIPSQVQSPTVAGLPTGYTYGVTRYADVILKEAFPDRFRDIRETLEDFRPSLDELRAPGGGRTDFVERFDGSLRNRLDGDQPVWSKQQIELQRRIELPSIGSTWVGTERTHEIDMFGFGSLSTPLPGVAVEMEWNNKDPFFDRDLNLFEALHRETAIAVGVIVTRGPKLQRLVGGVVRSKDGGFKYGQSSTHWDKLVPKVNLGGGGECPLLLIGIEPDRIEGVDLARRVRRKLDQAQYLKDNWRDTHQRWRDAKPTYDRLREEALDLMPPVPKQ